MPAITVSGENILFIETWENNNNKYMKIFLKNSPIFIKSNANDITIQQLLDAVKKDTVTTFESTDLEIHHG